MADVTAVGQATAKRRKPRKKLTQTQSWKTAVRGIWEDNPAFRMMLGICSTLAVTNQLVNSMVMGIAVTAVTIASSVTVSIIRNIVPRRTRMAVYTLVIATYVIFVDQLLKAYYPTISEALGPYVGLIITNCIIMGRAESFASSNSVWLSFMDALGVGLGYFISLMVIAFIRELLGFGTLFNYNILGPNWEPWVIMVMAPGAFIILGLYIWIIRGIQGE